MHRGDFAEVQRQHLVRTLAGADAYVPPPLPPLLSFDIGLVGQLSDADRALGELAGVSRTLPSPHLFTRALVRREAVMSSRIEGTPGDAVRSGALRDRAAHDSARRANRECNILNSPARMEEQPQE